MLFLNNKNLFHISILILFNLLFSISSLVINNNNNNKLNFKKTNSQKAAAEKNKIKKNLIQKQDQKELKVKGKSSGAIPCEAIHISFNLLNENFKSQNEKEALNFFDANLKKLTEELAKIPKTQIANEPVKINNALNNNSTNNNNTNCTFYSAEALMDVKTNDLENSEKIKSLLLSSNQIRNILSSKSNLENNFDDNHNNKTNLTNSNNDNINIKINENEIKENNQNKNENFLIKNLKTHFDYNQAEADRKLTDLLALALEDAKAQALEQLFDSNKEITNIEDYEMNLEKNSNQFKYGTLEDKEIYEPKDGIKILNLVVDVSYGLKAKEKNEKTFDAKSSDEEFKDDDLSSGFDFNIFDVDNFNEQKINRLNNILKGKLFASLNGSV